MYYLLHTPPPALVPDPWFPISITTLGALGVGWAVVQWNECKDKATPLALLVAALVCLGAGVWGIWVTQH